MKKRILVFVLVALSIFKGTAQNTDSLKQALANATDDSTKVFLLFSLYFHYKYVYPDSAFPYIREAFTLSKKISFDPGIPQSLLEMSDMSQALYNYKQALNYDSSALVLLTASKDTPGIGFTLSSVGNIYSDLHDYKNSLLYYHQALQIMTAYNRPAYLYTFYAGISGIFEQNNQLDSALYFATKAYQYDHNYCYGLQKMAIAYARLGKPDLALEFYLKSVQPALDANLRTDLVNIYNGIAQLYAGKNNPDSAVLYANKALLFEAGQHYPQGSLKASGILVNIYESIRNKDSVLKYLKITTALKDSLFNEEKDKLRTLENITYSEEIRNKDLEAAHVKNQNNLKLLLLLAGLAAAIVIAFILIRSNRQKEKDKLKIEKAYGDLKSTQAQLIQSEKMASLGELTAGIAHEIQNPLNFVNNFSEVNSELIAELKSEIRKGNLDEAEAIASDIETNEAKIKHHGQRADTIVKGMIQHSRERKGEKEPVDINVQAEEYLRLAYQGMRSKDSTYNAVLKTDFEKEIRKINLIPQDIGRVLLNLYNNAFYATAEKVKISGGDYKPIIEVGTRYFPSEGSRGAFIEVTIKDNGTGIPEKIIDKIFQPFFTTKPTGSGTGLGLSLSYDIVKAHGGEIKVRSQEARPDDPLGRGQYTEFIVVLPG